MDIESRISFDDTQERLRVDIPLVRTWHSYLFIIIYSILVIVWLAGTVYGVVEIRKLFEENQDLPRFFINFTGFIAIVFLLIWIWFGRKYIWRWWQYHLAGRVLLFIKPELLIVRRPISIFGLTDAYDLQHMTPFFFDSKVNGLAFNYGSQTVAITTNYPQREADWLMVKLNDRFFPGWNEEEEDDEDE